ncbi:MAG: hypothetical protein HY315_06840 [Acidobacteria bacterium]|nr:hypothetical protein [Acidobacteriota bacterium]
MARTSHGIASDLVHNEIVVPNPFAQAILFFRADAQGNEKPLRIIQGPKTLIGGGMDLDQVEVDPIHNEVYTTQRTSEAVLVFPREASGDVAPVRVLSGPKTQMRHPRRLTVDPVNDLMAVVSDQGILLFKRTDSGDVAPHCVISGPKTGLPNPARRGLARRGLAKALLYPDAKKIIFSGPGESGNFTGIWNYGDCGDVPPLYRFEEGAAAFDLIPEEKQIVMRGSGNSLKFFRMPEAF